MHQFRFLKVLGFSFQDLTSVLSVSPLTVRITTSVEVGGPSTGENDYCPVNKKNHIFIQFNYLLHCTMQRYLDWNVLLTNLLKKE